MYRLGCFLLLIVLSTGCERGGTLPKVKVCGSVSYNGKPVEHGNILFRPVDGTPGPANSAMINDGRYEMIARGGVPVGKHRVEVNAVASGKHDDNPDISTGLPTGAQFLPPKYNDESTLVFDATLSSEPLEYNLELTGP